MSRLANKPIQIPAGVDVKIDGHKITVKGKRGELTKDFFDYIILFLSLDKTASYIHENSYNKPQEKESGLNLLKLKAIMKKPLKKIRLNIPLN